MRDDRSEAPPKAETLDSVVPHDVSEAHSDLSSNASCACVCVCVWF